MTKSHNAQSSSLPQAYLERARGEINQIKALLQTTTFKTIGWMSWSIAPVTTSVSVPKTVYDAYNALIKHEKTDPIKALALYYAHFHVATRPEHDHASRQEETRQFYNSLTEKNGNTIFPDEPAAATLFDAHLKNEIDAIIIKRSPEQKVYLDFQKKILTEIAYIQSMLIAFIELQTGALLENKPELNLEIDFLNKVIDRMRMAELRDDVISYSQDALMILNSMSTRIPQQDQIRELRACIKKFQYHHCLLMTDLSDKKNALYFSAALQSTGVAISTPLMHLIPVPTDNLFKTLPELNIFTNGFTSATGAALEKVGKKNEEKKRVDLSVLHHIYDAAIKETSLSDKYVNAKQSLINTLKHPETKEKMAKVAAITAAVIIFPSLTVPAAVLSTVIAAGGVAYNLFSKHDEIVAAEKNSKKEKELHEKDMHIYRKQDAGIYTSQKVVGYWNEKNQARQSSSESAHMNNAASVNAHKKNT